MKVALLALLAALASALALADAVPAPSPKDPRIGIVDYSSEEVYSIVVARGVATRITLGAGEAIIDSGTGFVSNCEPPAEWCIKAEKGTNQIWVKPLTGATANNLELHTTRGDYSFRFVVDPKAEKSNAVFYRVIFRHPVVLPPVPLALPTADASSTAASTSKATDKPQADATPTSGRKPEFLTPRVRNYDYSRTDSPATRDLAPTVVFDDGRFTYLRFEKGQEVPAVFAIGVDGSEMRVTTHAERLAPDLSRPDDKVERDYLVVQRVARKLVLRLGAAVIEITNNKFDPKGVETYNGTTTDRLVREDK